MIETTASSVTPFSAAILKQTNCKSVSLGMETGNPDLRQGLLHKPTNNESYYKAFQLLEDNGIRKVSFNMIGLPNESQAYVFRTIAMNRLVGTDTQAVGIFYPYKGTPIRDMMVQKGWMDDDFELRTLQNYNFNTFTAGNGSVVRHKDMDGDILNKLYYLFSSYTVMPVALWPLLDYIKQGEGDQHFAQLLWKNINLVSYFVKFKEWPPGFQGRRWTDLDARMEGIRFEDSRADAFATLLLEYWADEEVDTLRSMLVAITRGELEPQFPVPQDAGELKEWLGIVEGSREDRRKVRQSLRDIAEANSALYSPEQGGIVAGAAPRSARPA